MTSIKTILAAATILVSGSAFANETSDSLSRAITESRAAFSSKSTVQRNDFTGNIPAAQIRANANQANTFPVNTMDLSNGSTK